MKWITLDQDEPALAPPDSEQSLRIGVAVKGGCMRELPDFAARVWPSSSPGVLQGPTLGEPVPFHSMWFKAQVSLTLESVAGIAIPQWSDCPVHVVSEDCDYIVIILCPGDRFVYFEWSTSA